ncbi:hypothetical protein D3C83_152080 [compost metagenome]
MVAVRMRQVGDGDAGLAAAIGGIGRRLAGGSGEFLEQRQRLELERVQVEGVAFLRHRT